MASYSNLKVWFWDDSLSALGSTTNVLSARYKCGIDTIGDGEFVIPLVDTQTRQWCEKYNVATMTVEIDGNQACFGEIVIDRGDEVIRQGQPDLYVVKGRGRLSKLTLDRMNYQIISDGSQGTTTAAVSDILAMSQYATWINSTTDYAGGFSNASAYLVTANETLLDAVIQALNQNNHHTVDIPGFGSNSGSSETPENRFYYVYGMDQLSTSVSGWGDWHFKTGADPSDNYELPILSIDKILEEKEIITRAIVHGGGLGSGTFTIEEASGTKTAPSGYSYDFTNSVITNTTLEAVSNQPKKVGVAKLSNIKPEDPSDATSVQTAAEQLVDAGQRWIEERQGGYDTYYKVTSLANVETVSSRSVIAWPGWDAVRLEYSKDSPYNTSGSEVTTTIIDVDSAFHILEVEYSITTGTSESDGKLFGNYLLGPAPRQERSGEAIVADEIKELKRRLDHADAGAATSTTPGGTTYVTTDAPLLTATASTSLANERNAVDGDGTNFVDNGAGSTFTFNVDVTDIIGNGLTESSNNINLGTPSTLTGSTTNGVTVSSHTHAVSLNHNDLGGVSDDDHHPPITFGSDTNSLFSVGASQVINFDTQSANTVLAGPVSGGAGDPTMRALVEADLPSTVQMGEDDELAYNRFIAVFKNVPGARGFWPPSHIRGGGNLAGLIAANHLTNNNAAQFGYDDLAPYVNLNGSNQYFSHADDADFDLTGTETYIISGYRGLTFGGWFYFDNTATGTEMIMSKWDSPSNLSYNLNRQSGGNIRFAITSGGSTATQDFVDSSGTVGSGVWRFIVGRFNPGTEVAVFVNGTKTTETSGIGVSVYSGTASFEIGANGGGNNLLDGRYGGGFLSMMYLSDTVVDYLFESTRGLFGV